MDTQQKGRTTACGLDKPDVVSQVLVLCKEGVLYTRVYNVCLQGFKRPTADVLLRDITEPSRNSQYGAKRGEEGRIEIEFATGTASSSSRVHARLQATCHPLTYF